MMASYDRVIQGGRSVREFMEQVGIVREVYNDTITVFERLRSFTHRAVSETAVFNQEDDEAIRRVFEQQPAIVVAGRPDLRASIINLILGENLFPPKCSETAQWRMVRILYGKTRSLRQVYLDDDMVDADEFEMADVRAAAFDEQQVSPEGGWLTEADLDASAEDPAYSVHVEASVTSPLLENGVVLMSTPSHAPGQAQEAIDRAARGVSPFFVLGLDLSRPLTTEEHDQLQHLQDKYPTCPVLFVACVQSSGGSVPASPVRGEVSPTSMFTTGQEALMRFGFFKSSEVPLVDDDAAAVENGADAVEVQFKPMHQFVEDMEELTMQFPVFFVRNLNQWVLCAASAMHRAHINCLTSFIHLAFEMSRDVLLTPQRIKYARSQERELFVSLLGVANSKQNELQTMIEAMLAMLAPVLQEEAASYVFTDVELPSDKVVRDGRTVRRCHEQIKTFVFERLSSSVASQLANSIDRMKESLLGTLQRCLHTLEENALSDESVLLNRSLSTSPPPNGRGFLAEDKVREEGSSPVSSTTAALQELLSTVYQLEFSDRMSFSTIKLLLERVRQSIRFMPWKSSVCLDGLWKRTVADKQIESVNAARLSKSVCAQFRSKLVRAHDRFTFALRELEVLHSARLQETDGARAEVRKQFAPRVARLALHSTSLCDLIRHGMPEMGVEIGRGQYGVVYSCAPWAGHTPVCVKSVVPPDEKHWNDLAMEYHYMWSLPTHERIVALHGSVVDYSYGEGDNPAVLLILERMQRDLHSGLKHGLSWPQRLQIATDVIEGIRFLHSQGLVHRDIKLKNILLDTMARAKLTDLGFCKPEAMMTCSVVGTPIHMAPELFSGEYSVSVDVYAFGVLFWYICSNQTRLPAAYDRCQSKDQLWYEVQRGLRPEHLPLFNDQCWKLMTSCWVEQPLQRPLPGIIYSELTAMLEKAKVEHAEKAKRAGSSPRRKTAAATGDGRSHRRVF